MPSHRTPQVSVVIPTYNRAELLRKNLAQLADQTLDRGDFEVVVSDDGSSDHTRDVVDAFRDRLSLRYHFQEDLGVRATVARNAGAWLASAPLLVFLDTGTFVGRDFVRAHLEAHRRAGGRIAIAGYAYAYDAEGVDPTLATTINELAPDLLVEREGKNPRFRDNRHDTFAACDFDLTRRALPWQVFFTLNCSVAASDFAAVGGFDEEFEGWGFEDCELAYRLDQAGVTIQVSREAWVVESPHERDPERFDQLMVNMHRFFTKYPQPMLEIGWVLIKRSRRTWWTWEDDLHDLETWTEQSRHLDVRDEIGAATRDLPSGERIAVLGAGGRVPDSLPPAVLADFDRHLLDRAVSGSAGRHTGLFAMGLRTTLPDQAVDSVIITSRLSGLWKRWESDILAEARRIGRAVHVAFDGGAAG